MTKEDFNTFKEIVSKQEELGKQIHEKKKQIKEIREERDFLSRQIEARLHGFKEYDEESSLPPKCKFTDEFIVVLRCVINGELAWHYGIARYENGWIVSALCNETIGRLCFGQKVIAYRKLRKAKNYLVKIGQDEGTENE